MRNPYRTVEASILNLVYEAQNHVLLVFTGSVYRKDSKDNFINFSVDVMYVETPSRPLQYVTLVLVTCALLPLAHMMRSSDAIQLSDSICRSYLS